MLIMVDMGNVASAANFAALIFWRSPDSVLYLDTHTPARPAHSNR